MSGIRIHGEAAATGDAIAEAVDTASAFAARAGLCRRDGDRLRVVVEELVTNVVEHGRAAAGSTIAFAFEAEAAAVRITLTDQGGAFDPRSRSDDEASPKAPHEGGWGWLILLSWCRIEDYRREGGRNHLLLRMPAEFTG